MSVSWRTYSCCETLPPKTTEPTTKRGKAASPAPCQNDRRGLGLPAAIECRKREDCPQGSLSRPPGWMNANLCGSIRLYCMSGHVWPLQPSSLTRGRPPQPPRPLLPRPKPRWRRGAKRLDGAEVRCEGSSRIFCKIHYRAFASPTAPKNGIGRCTLTRNPQWSRPTHA